VDVDIHSQSLSTAYQQCTSLPSDAQRAECQEQARRQFEVFRAGWPKVFLVALAAVPVASAASASAVRPKIDIRATGSAEIRNMNASSGPKRTTKKIFTFEVRQFRGDARELKSM
jgi:hypothetical protein